MSDKSAKNEMLSDQEIDALVNQTNEANFDDGEFRIHDFSGRQSLSMAKWTEFSALNLKHAEALQAALTSDYSVSIDVQAVSEEYDTAANLMASFPKRMCLVSTPTEPFGADAHLLLPGALLTSLVNLYFGGKSLASPQMTGRVTPSEQRIGERFSKTFFRAMSELWSDRLSITFGDLYVDITPDRFSMIPKEIGFAVIPFNVTIDAGESHTVKLILPFKALERSSVAFMQADITESAHENLSDWEPEIRAVLPDVKLEISGKLFEVKSTLRALLQMQIGTTLPIDEPTTIALLLNNDLLAEGNYGAFDGFKAMQINQIGEKIHE